MNVEQQIRARVDAFVAELSELVKQAALERLTDALGTSAQGQGASKGKRGKAAGRSPALSKKGGKRTAEELEAFSDRILATIKAQPGIRADQIAAELGLVTREVVLPIKKLLATKTVTKKGQKRATAYFPGRAK